MKNTVETIKRTYAEVKTISGYTVNKKNPYYSYTVRCTEMTVEFTDGTKEIVHQDSKRYTHSGCGYNKTEHAIHTTLNRIIKDIPIPGGFHTYQNHSLKGSDFFRQHYFEFDLKNNSITIY